MSKTSPVTEALEKLGIPYRLHIHETPLRSLEQAARERKIEPTQIVRTLLFRCEKQSYILVLMAGTTKVNWTKLRRYLGVSRITTATSEQVLETTGYKPGAVSPFGLPSPMRILADNGINNHEDISMGVGIPNAGILIQRKDVLDALEIEFGDFGE